MPNRSRLFLLAAASLLAGCQDGPLSPAAEAPAGPQPGLRTGYVLTPSGNPRKISYEVRDGLAIIEGDIVVGPAEGVAASPEQAVRSPRGRFQMGPGVGDARQWPNGVVPYVIDANVDRAVVLDAMAQIEYRTSRINDATGNDLPVGQRVNFVPRNGQDSYIFITNGSGCHSAIGRTGGRQVVSLDRSSAGTCQTVGIAAHEFSHALGLAHEQSRCDRDDFVAVQWDNIQAGYEGNFFKMCPNDGYRLIARYDEGSVMHYGPKSFSRNGANTITSLRGRTDEMGQRDGLSWSDVHSIQWMYGWNAGRSGPNGPYRVWNAPDFDHGVDREVQGSTMLRIVCQTTGPAVTGPWNNTSRIWDKLADGGYIADAYVWTGSEGYVSARC